MVLISGHRGAKGLHPENTLGSFQRALDCGVDYLECDVRLTRDGHVLVMHDETVDRTTNGTGAVADLDLSTLRKLDAGKGEIVPTLEEVLNLAAGRARVLCELKDDAAVDSAVALVQARNQDRDVTFISFDFDRIRRVKAIDDSLRTSGVLWDLEPGDIRKVAKAGADEIDLHYKRLSLQLIDRVRRWRLGLRVYSPNRWRDQQMMIALGVDVITTDRPDILARHLRAEAKKAPPAVVTLRTAEALSA